MIRSRDYETINHELALYSELLSHKPQIVVLSKMDLTGAEAAADTFQKAIESHPANNSPKRIFDPDIRRDRIWYRRFDINHR